jgi:hypothetical protein
MTDVYPKASRSGWRIGTMSTITDRSGVSFIRSRATGRPEPCGVADRVCPGGRLGQLRCGAQIARLVEHASTRTTEIVYRRELRPVITAGAEIMDQLFTAT